MEKWFSSDLHLSHENIITYSDRPFANAREMDEFMLTLHNQYVKPEDHWTNLGDLTMARSNQQAPEFVKLIKRFNGHKRLHLGNHDHFPIKTYLEAGFEKIYATWRDEGGLLFSHIPIHPGSMGSAKANIHGHIHERPSPSPVVWMGYPEAPLVQPYIKPYINICVEKTDYRPLHYDELLSLIQVAKDNYKKELDGKTAAVQEADGE